MGLDPVDPSQQLAHLFRVVVDLLYLIEVADPLGVGQNVLPLGSELGTQVVATIVHQQAVLQIQRPGARVEVVAGEQGPLVIHEDPLEMVGVALATPEHQVETTIIDVMLVALGKLAQVGLVEIGQAADGGELLLRRDEEVVGGLVAHHNGHLAAALQQIFDILAQLLGRVEVRGTDEDLPLGGAHQIADHLVELVVALAQTRHRGDGHLLGVDRHGGEAVLPLTQTQLEAADRPLQLFGAGHVAAIQPLHGVALHEQVIHVVDHAAGQLRADDLVIAVEAVAILLVQVDVVEAGTGVEHRIVKDEALEVQHAEQLAPLHRYAVDFDLVLVAGSHLLIHQVVAALLAPADQAALGTVEVDEHLDVESRIALLGLVEGGEDLATRVVILQIERDQIDALGSTGNECKNAALEILGAVEHFKLVCRDGDLGQACQQLSIMGR